MIKVVVYSRPGCHLCEMVEGVLRHVRKTRDFELIVKNIDEDAGDFEKYKHEIPVVVVNGREVGRHRLTATEFEAALEGV